MSDWSNGYVSEVNYTYGYYHELNPARIKLAFLYQGLVCPEIDQACELGFGQGISVNIHAPASATQWHGTDFNPAQVGFAQSLATASQAHVQLADQAFAEFCRRDDLPQFDYIGMHGIWSWVSDENRTLLVDFLRRKLKVGGVLYVSYNTQPGLASVAPLRDLLVEHSDLMSASGKGVEAGIAGALDFAAQLFALQPAFARSNPLAVERLELMKTQPSAYLAHEYFNRDWLPMSFSKLAQWLGQAKLSFACSASYHELIDAMSLLPEQIAFLRQIPDPVFRQTARDFMLNQGFRKDYWVRGLRKLTSLARSEQLREMRLMLTTPPSEVGMTIKGAMGEASMNAAVYRPILDFLADHTPKTILQIERAVAEHGVTPGQLHQALLLLAGSGHLHTAQTDAEISRARSCTDRLNAHMIDLARGDGSINYLASPVTGGGFLVRRFEQLFLQGRQLGHKSAAELAQHAGAILLEQGQPLLVEGMTFTEPEHQRAELQRRAAVFLEKQLPLIKARGICT
jgi:SAM-dependent methyltransferase